MTTCVNQLFHLVWSHAQSVCRNSGRTEVAGEDAVVAHQDLGYVRRRCSQRVGADAWVPRFLHAANVLQSHLGHMRRSSTPAPGADDHAGAGAAPAVAPADGAAAVVPQGESGGGTTVQNAVEGSTLNGVGGASTATASPLVVQQPQQAGDGASRAPDSQ